MRRPVNIFGNPAGSLIFGGFWFVYLFFVGASAIYSLIKSPVPDAASPVHGYSRSMAYARGFYLISLSCLLFLLIFIESNIQEMVLKLEIRNSRDVRKTRRFWEGSNSKIRFKSSIFKCRLKLILKSRFSKVDFQESIYERSNSKKRVPKSRFSNVDFQKILYRKSTFKSRFLKVELQKVEFQKVDFHKVEVQMSTFKRSDFKVDFQKSIFKSRFTKGRLQKSRFSK